MRRYYPTLTRRLPRTTLAGGRPQNTIVAEVKTVDGVFFTTANRWYFGAKP